MMSLFPVRSLRRDRTRPQGGSLSVPRPDASNPTGTHNGSHPKGRSNAADGIAVDLVSMSVGLLVSVGKLISGGYLGPSECILVLYEAAYVAVQHRFHLN